MLRTEKKKIQLEVEVLLPVQFLENFVLWTLLLTKCSEVLPTVNVGFVVFWDIVACSLVNRYHY